MSPAAAEGCQLAFILACSRVSSLSCSSFRSSAEIPSAFSSGPSPMGGVHRCSAIAPLVLALLSPGQDHFLVVCRGEKRVREVKWCVRPFFFSCVISRYVFGCFNWNRTGRGSLIFACLLLPFLPLLLCHSS